MSPITSPTFSSGHGDVEPHDRLQQHRVGVDATACLKAIEPAILNAISDESTLW